LNTYNYFSLNRTAHPYAYIQDVVNLNWDLGSSSSPAV
jgi:hypothetical protein